MSRALAILLLLAASATLGSAQTADCIARLQYTDAGLSGMEAPRRRSDLIRLRDAPYSRERYQREARAILSRVTRPANGCPDLPAWLTWYAFPKPQRSMVAPRPALLTDFELRPPAKLPPQQRRDVNSVEISLFNKEALAHILRPKGLPAGASLHDPATRNALVEGGHREIPEFPDGAIVVKSMWQFVPIDRPYLLRTWESPPNAGATSFPETAWPTCVWVVAKIPPNLPPPPCRSWAAISDFVNVPYLPQIKSPTKPPPRTRLILTAFHVTTKEIPDWVWATFWYTPLEVSPNGLGRDPGQRGAWQHYDMKLGLSMIKPLEGRPPRRYTIFNPYIEAAFPLGLQSNCTTCHSLAAAPPTPCQKHIREDGTSCTLDTYEGRLKVDFIWSLETRTPR
jgi:hypothetical protein